MKWRRGGRVWEGPCPSPELCPGVEISAGQPGLVREGEGEQRVELGLEGGRGSSRSFTEIVLFISVAHIKLLIVIIVPNVWKLW